MKTRKILVVLLALVIFASLMVGCTEAERVSYNLSKEADFFNVVRELTVINCITHDVIFQMTGKISITVDGADDQLEITVEDENGEYQKHFVGLADNVTYVLEQKDYKDVSKYRYTLNFNPKMWIPVDVKEID